MIGANCTNCGTCVSKCPVKCIAYITEREIERLSA
ncbi:MAG: 4Fe-4S binding protein [Synergistaceae bacterium]|nr:4Fe-4S binding protein [Synergistaceae bacterium]